MGKVVKYAFSSPIEVVRSVMEAWKVDLPLFLCNLYGVKGVEVRETSDKIYFSVSAEKSAFPNAIRMQKELKGKTVKKV